MKKILNYFLPAILSANAYAVQEQQPAPACPAVFSTSQTSFDPANFKGKVVLIDFWATWCPPCIKSMPFFNSLHNTLSTSGFEVVAINVDEDAKTAHEFLTDHPVDYPVAFDPNGNCPKTYELKGMPSSYLLDKSGKVNLIHIGYKDSDQAHLRDRIDTLLKQ
jgi:thiol-disulfide isomerase/thioredoxin